MVSLLVKVKPHTLNLGIKKANKHFPKFCTRKTKTKDKSVAINYIIIIFYIFSVKCATLM